jgi:hypothetical protein
MKTLALLCLFLLVLLAAPICSAQSPNFPYVFTGTPMTCAPQSSCINTLYLPAGWYGSIYENGAVQCFSAPPWAQGYRLNLFVQVNESYCRTNTLLEAYLYTNTVWNYAPGNPWAQNNVIWAAGIGATGAIYSIVNNNYYLVGSEFLKQDCYTGSETQSGGTGGTC